MNSIYILGAGFSKPAGFPLGSELFEEILGRAKQSSLYDNILKPDIDKYIKYQYAVNKLRMKEDKINFEDFLSFLDIEHFLGLKGSDTWSKEGNKSQILIKNFIAKILYERLFLISQDKLKLYLDFARRLDSTDYIITFNYDTLIESCLEKLGKPFRLFPIRFTDIGTFSGIMDTNDDEIVVLKMHGSIDWFDITPFERSFQYSKADSFYYEPRHVIFNNWKLFQPQKIIQGPYFPDSPLNKIYRARNLEKFFEYSSMVIEAPLIISPSFSKMIYLNPLRGFWNGIYNAGFMNKKVTIIGFSLQEHDDYVRQPIFNIINNFQNRKVDPKMVNRSKLTIIDFRKNKKEVSEYKNNYNFVNWRKTYTDFGGFSESSLGLIFK